MGSKILRVFLSFICASRQGLTANVQLCYTTATISAARSRTQELIKYLSTHRPVLIKKTSMCFSGRCRCTALDGGLTVFCRSAPGLCHHNSSLGHHLLTRILLQNQTSQTRDDKLKPIMIGIRVTHWKPRYCTIHHSKLTST